VRGRLGLQRSLGYGSVIQSAARSIRPGRGLADRATREDIMIRKDMVILPWVHRKLHGPDSAASAGV